MRRSVIAISVVQRSNQARKSRNRLSARRISPTAIAGQVHGRDQAPEQHEGDKGDGEKQEAGEKVVHEILLS